MLDAARLQTCPECKSRCLYQTFLERDSGPASAADSGTPKPIPDKNSWSTQVVNVVAEGDYVTVAVARECVDPRTPGKTYTTTWFDMWRFVDGKADEHWDFGTVAGPEPRRRLAASVSSGLL